MDLRMRFRCRPGSTTEWDITVNGNGYLIAAWSRWMERELPIVAEGYTEAGSGRQSRSVAVSLVARWTDWCIGDNDNCSTAITSTGRDTGHWYWPVIDVPDTSSHLQPRMMITDDLVGRWLAKDVPEEIVIEELHTAVESLLRSVVGKGRWPSLLAIARTQGAISPTERKTLDQFNTLYRNRLKHRGMALDDKDRQAAAEIMHEVLQTVECLLGRLS